MSNRVQTKKRASSIALNNKDPLIQTSSMNPKHMDSISDSSTNIAISELSHKQVNFSKRPALKDISNIENHSHSHITVKIQKDKKKVKTECSAHRSYKQHGYIKTILQYSPLSSSLRTSNIRDFESTYLDYGDEIYSFLCQLQKLYSPHPFPLESSSLHPECSMQNSSANSEGEITPSMRRILIDWLSEVVDDYHLKVETLHLAVNYLDRYLSIKALPRAYLQLLGAASLLIASKFEESYPCKIKELVEVCNGCYTTEQIGLMERKIIATLEFGLHVSTIHTFIHCILAKIFDSNEQLHPISQGELYFIQFLSELCLSNYELLQYSYEEIAKAILHVSSIHFDGSHRKSSFMILCQHILDMITSPYYETVPGIVSRYSSERYQNIAHMNPIYCTRYGSNQQ